jgi:hypothetical protein
MDTDSAVLSQSGDLNLEIRWHMAKPASISRYFHCPGNKQASHGLSKLSSSRSPSGSIMFHLFSLIDCEIHRVLAVEDRQSQGHVLVGFCFVTWNDEGAVPAACPRKPESYYRACRVPFRSFSPFRGAGDNTTRFFRGNFSIDSCHSCCAASLASALTTSCTCSNRPGESLPYCLVGRCGKETVQRNVKFKDGRWDTSQGDDFKKQGSTYLKSHLRHDEHQPADLSTKGSNIHIRGGTPNGLSS